MNPPESLAQPLDDRLASSSTISSPIIKLSEAELYQHLRTEEMLAFVHALRALKCHASLDRQRERLLEDLQDVLCIPDGIARAEAATAENDVLVGLIRRRTIAERRGTLGESTEASSKDHEFYCLMRQDELLAYHHLEKALAAVPSPTKAHARLLEDAGGVFEISAGRAELEHAMAASDPVLLLIRANGISTRRASFAGRRLDDSFTPAVDAAKSRLIEAALAASDEAQVPASETHERSIDLMYREILLKRDACAKQEITADEWRAFLEACLGKLGSMKVEIARSRDGQRAYCWK